MHTYMYRMNALFTVASTALAVICAAAALTDWTFTSDPPVSLQVKSYDGLQVCLLLALYMVVSLVATSSGLVNICNHTCVMC